MLHLPRARLSAMIWTFEDEESGQDVWDFLGDIAAAGLDDDAAAMGAKPMIDDELGADDAAMDELGADDASMVDVESMVDD